MTFGGTLKRNGWLDMEVLKVIFTALLSVAALFVVTKVMGHKQVAQLDFFDYVSGITIGSIGAELATELEEPHKPLIALVIYGVVSIVLNLVAHKFPRTRKYINGTPTILMDNGTFYRANFKKAKLDLSEFMLLCRQCGYFNLDEIQTAVFEHDGRLSVLPTSKSRSLTPNDLSIEPAQAEIGTELIMDGRIMGENLERIGRDIAWLEGELKRHKQGKIHDIYLAVYHPESEKITVYKSEG